MIRMLVSWWELRHKPYSVAILGRYSGNQSPPLDFIRFRTMQDAELWILQRDLLSNLSLTERLTEYIAIDLRLVEQDPLLR